MIYSNLHLDLLICKFDQVSSYANIFLLFLFGNFSGFNTGHRVKGHTWRETHTYMMHDLHIVPYRV